MCLAFPGTVKKISGNTAIVSYPSSSKKVLIGDAQVIIGSKVLIQMGIIIKVLSDSEYQTVLDAWNSLRV